MKGESPHEDDTSFGKTENIYNKYGIERYVKELNFRIGEFIAESNSSYRMVELKSFNRLMELATKGTFAPMKRKAAASLVRSTFERMLDDFKVVLNDPDEVVSLSMTTDGGLLNNGQPFVTVTGHFMDRDMALRSILLAFISEACQQTGNHHI